MTLITDAENAEDIGDAFSKFKIPVPDHAPDITASTSELYAIGSNLREIDHSMSSPEYSRNYRLIENDLDMVRSSLNETMDDIFRILGDIGNGSRILKDGMYRQTWKDIAIFFAQNRPMSLRNCLEIYRRFLSEQTQIIRRRTPKTLLYGDLRNDIQALVPVQDRLSDALNGLSMGGKGALTKPRSYERDRPNISPPPAHHNHRDYSPRDYSPRDHGPRDYSPRDYSPRDNRPPSVPDVPDSPPSSVTQTTSQSSSAEFESDHWARTAFQDTSTTHLPRSGDVSRCYGESALDVRSRLRDDSFEEVVQISFPGPSKLTARLFFRESDHRARLLCKWTRSSGRGSKYSCLPLNILEFRRVDSSLQICKTRPGKQNPELWATFVFSTIERLVICHCTLVSLRGHDTVRSVSSIQDDKIFGEAEVFGGKIIDDNYLHALFVFRDRDSDAVRLHASVHQGELKKVPVWTAFITHYVASSKWLRQGPNPCIIHLKQLNRHIFASDYEPQVRETGEHVLKFTSPADAAAFKQTIKDIAVFYAERAKPVRNHSFHAEPDSFHPMPPPPPPVPYPNHFGAGGF